MKGGMEHNELRALFIHFISYRLLSILFFKSFRVSIHELNKKDDSDLILILLISLPLFGYNGMIFNLNLIKYNRNK